MSDFPSKPCTAFAGDHRIAAGRLADVALAVREAIAAGANPLVFDDETGAVIDLDLRGSPTEILARLAARSAAETAALPSGPAADRQRNLPAGLGRSLPAPPRRRGRPALGVVAREVTLLPRHWEWLAAQPGGASVALRRLVEEARRSERGRARAAQEAAYRFLSAIAGNLAGFEEAIRALFAGDRRQFE